MIENHIKNVSLSYFSENFLSNRKQQAGV